MNAIINAGCAEIPTTTKESRAVPEQGEQYRSHRNFKVRRFSLMARCKTTRLERAMAAYDDEHRDDYHFWPKPKSKGDSWLDAIAIVCVVAILAATILSATL
jgi:hypothetical protein